MQQKRFLIPNVHVIPLLASLHTTSHGTASGVYWTAPVRADGNGKDSRQPIACGQIHHRRGSRKGDPTTMMPNSQIFFVFVCLFCSLVLWLVFFGVSFA